MLKFIDSANQRSKLYKVVNYVCMVVCTDVVRGFLENIEDSVKMPSLFVRGLLPLGASIIQFIN